MRETFVVFEVAGTAYAVQSAQIQLVEMVGTISPVPRAPAFVEGVMATRGLVIPVVSMRKRFNLPEADNSDARQKLRSRVLVIHVEGRIIGMRVDSAHEFIQVDPDQILPVPESLSGPGTEYLDGAISQPGRIILIVNLSMLFATSERRELLEQSEL
jgi:purine-binding chemotaxis protein CheW